jgi:hypothetical protein
MMARSKSDAGRSLPPPAPRPTASSRLFPSYRFLLEGITWGVLVLRVLFLLLDSAVLCFGFHTGLGYLA